MAKRVKVGPLVVLLIVLGAALTLVLTNPGDKDFSTYLASKGAQTAQRNVGGLVGDALKSVGELAGKGEALTYKRTNLYLFSLYTPSNLIGGKTYLGLLKKLFIGF